MTTKTNKREGKRTWRKVKAPVPWRSEQGDELIGKFVATERREGQHGEYNAHVIACEDGVLRHITGRIADEHFALIAPGTVVKVVFDGFASVGSEGHSMKLMSIFTEVLS